MNIFFLDPLELHQIFPHSPRIAHHRQPIHKIIKLRASGLIGNKTIIFFHQWFDDKVRERIIEWLALTVMAFSLFFVLLYVLAFRLGLLFLHFCILYFGSYYFLRFFYIFITLTHRIIGAIFRSIKGHHVSLRGKSRYN